jgi:hypothetical protein
MNQEAQRHDICCELVCDAARISGEVRLKVAGASMLPALWPGDLLTVRSCDSAKLKEKQIALYRRNGKLTAHRIKQVSGDRLILQGDALLHFDPPVEASEIVGQVVGILRSGRTVRLEHAFWQQVVSFMLRHSDLFTRATLYLSRRLARSWNLRTPFRNPSPQSHPS